MKLTIQVSEHADLRELCEVEVEAWMVGDWFAIHQTQTEEPAEDDPWTVTHLPSKLAVGDRYPTRTHALHAAMALDELGLPLDAVEVHEDVHVWPKEWLHRIHNVVCRFNGHEHNYPEAGA